MPADTRCAATYDGWRRASQRRRNSSSRLRARPQIVVDNPATVQRESVREMVGRLAAEDVARLTVALAIVTRLAD